MIIIMIQVRKRTFPLHAYNSKKKEEEEEKNFKIFLRKDESLEIYKKKKKNSSMRGEEYSKLERKKLHTNLVLQNFKAIFFTHTKASYL